MLKRHETSSRNQKVFLHFDFRPYVDCRWPVLGHRERGQEVLPARKGMIHPQTKSEEEVVVAVFFAFR